MGADPTTSWTLSHRWGHGVQDGCGKTWMKVFSLWFYLWYWKKKSCHVPNLKSWGRNHSEECFLSLSCWTTPLYLLSTALDIWVGSFYSAPTRFRCHSSALNDFCHLWCKWTWCLWCSCWTSAFDLYPSENNVIVFLCCAVFFLSSFFGINYSHPSNLSVGLKLRSSMLMCVLGRKKLVYKRAALEWMCSISPALGSLWPSSLNTSQLMHDVFLFCFFLLHNPCSRVAPLQSCSHVTAQTFAGSVLTFFFIYWASQHVNSALPRRLSLVICCWLSLMQESTLSQCDKN